MRGVEANMAELFGGCSEYLVWRRKGRTNDEEGWENSKLTWEQTIYYRKAVCLSRR